MEVLLVWLQAWSGLGLQAGGDVGHDQGGGNQVAVRWLRELTSLPGLLVTGMSGYIYKARNLS